MSKIEVNEIDKQSGSTLTLGGSGTTVQLGTGASQTGFGREGSVNWQTGSIKTGNFTAASGEGYFINSSGSITMNLPAGSAGAIVAVSDYARNFATHNFIVSPNGSEKIGGTASSATLDVNGQAATFVYVDSTKGWINVQNAEDTETGAVNFMAATGGTVSTCGDFKVHKFTGPGTFCVSQISTVCSSRNNLFYAVVAGGGSGGREGAGGGGAGGFRLGGPGPFPSTPLAASALTATATAFPITVGAGGAGKSTSPCIGNSGSPSIFSSITSAGGGGGGSRGNTPKNGIAGGSGGGGGGSGPGSPSAGCRGSGGSGNTPSVSPAQGTNGGVGGCSGAHQGGGGGGGTAAGGGVGGNPGSSPGGPGGAGGSITELFGASPKPFYGPTNGVLAGGGGGAGRASPGPAPGGSAGSGGGGQGEGQSMSVQSGTVNTGGGGGGVEFLGTTSGSGGSGIVYIKYKFQ